MRQVFTVLLTSLLFPVVVGAAEVADSAKPPCSSPEASQFDFWLGDWNLTWGDTLGGTNHVTKPLGDCVIQEQFSTNGAAPFKGMSFSVYNPLAGEWLQTWVDNSGAYMLFTGKFADGRMVLSREVEKDGKRIDERMVFYNIAPNSFDWDWQASTDDGKIWKTNWHIQYRRAAK